MTMPILALRSFGKNCRSHLSRDIAGLVVVRRHQRGQAGIRIGELARGGIADLQRDGDNRDFRVVDFVDEGLRHDGIKRQETDGVDLLGDQVVQRVALLFDTAARIENDGFYASFGRRFFETLAVETLYGYSRLAGT